MQTLFLSREHIQTLHTADVLNAALAARVAQLETRQLEVEQLNVELRHQIADRSGHLVAAIRTMIDPGAKTPALAPGQIVQERYELQREIGSGGMGTVYEVVRLADRRHLALKVAHGFDAIALARLAREAQIASQLAHPNMVAILDVDISDQGFLYIVMELVVGKTLHEMRDRFGDPAWALPVLAEIADGLAALHRSGIVHRDLKPANVMLAEGANGERVAKIMDFGISRISQDETGSSGSMPSLDRTAPTLRENPRGPKSSPRSSSNTLTQAGSLCGTPQYMAPELMHVDRVLPSADVFSLGVLAYELLTKDAPWPEPASVVLDEGRILAPAISLAIHLPALDPAVATLFDRCLLLAPGDRPTAQDVALQLAKVKQTDA
ncbi:MAG: serine/threonine protein kinase [Deltaproteobacteria bacterium]|nr:serine/threonine protein kinase [Deltaproteobacteria bacterium]